MKCDKCGADVKERFFMPLGPKLNLRDGLWVCFNCLPPKEQLRLKLRGPPAKKDETLELSDEEYEGLVKKASWKCPHRKRAEDCAGEFCSIDEWDACVEALHARRILDRYFGVLGWTGKFGRIDKATVEVYGEKLEVPARSFKVAGTSLPLKKGNFQHKNS